MEAPSVSSSSNNARGMRSPSSYFPTLAMDFRCGASPVTAWSATVVGVTEPAYLTTTRASYDTVADDYVEFMRNRFAEWALGRSMLAAFAELVQAGGGGPVADIGCGPGHVTAYLASLGLSAFGIDLSPRMIANARRIHPDLRF